MNMDSARDLRGLSRQVMYEFEMTEALAKRQVDLIMGRPQQRWRERFSTPDPLHRDWFEMNAMLESQLMHVRALTKFLFEPPPSPAKRAGDKKRGKPGGLADGFAEDYFDDPLTEWRKHAKGRPRRPALLTDDSLNQISREIAHLTYERAGFVDGGSNWSPYALYAQLADVVERFGGRVDAARLCEDFVARVAAAMPPRQPTPNVVLPAATQGLRPA